MTTINYGWNAKLHKREARSFSLDGAVTSGLSLWMPSNECVCVAEALLRKILTPASRVICVEHDPDIFATMKKGILSLELKHPILWKGELSALPLTEPLDLINLDFCGALNDDVMLWVTDRLVGHIADGARISLTTRFSWRHNFFMDHCAHRLLHDYRSLTEEVTSETASRHDEEVIPLMIFLAALRDYVADIRVLRYRDVNENHHGVAMMLYRFDNVRLRHANEPTLLPTLDQLLEGYDIMDDIPVNRSNAAKQAWITRHYNEQVQLERKKKLSERALKAWRTRRAKQQEA